MTRVIAAISGSGSLRLPRSRVAREVRAESARPAPIGKRTKRGGDGSQELKLIDRRGNVPAIWSSRRRGKFEHLWLCEVAFRGVHNFSSRSVHKLTCYAAAAPHRSSYLPFVGTSSWRWSTRLAFEIPLWNLIKAHRIMDWSRRWEIRTQ